MSKYISIHVCRFTSKCHTSRYIITLTLNGSDIPNGSNAERSEGFPENRFEPLPEKKGSLLDDVGTEKAENRSLPPPELVVPNGSFFLSSLAPLPTPPTPPVALAPAASEEDDCALSSAPSSRWELVLNPLMLLTGLLDPA